MSAGRSPGCDPLKGLRHKVSRVRSRIAPQSQSLTPNLPALSAEQNQLERNNSFPGEQGLTSETLQGSEAGLLAGLSLLRRRVATDTRLSADPNRQLQHARIGYGACNAAERGGAEAVVGLGKGWRIRNDE